MKRIVGLFIGFFALIYWFTNGVIGTYFQQDEWNGFGLVIQLAHGPWYHWFGLLSPSHFIPLSQFIWFAMYRLFGFDASYYALAALMLHTLSTVLVYFLAMRLVKNSWVGMVTAFLFATNFRAAQAFTHLAIFPATLTSFVVIMAFLLYMVHRLTMPRLTKHDVIVLLGLFLLSMTLREDGLILPVLLPTYLYFFNRKSLSRQNLWFFVVFYGVIFGFLVFRVVLQLTNPYAVHVASGGIKMIVYNALTLPFKLVVQNMFEGIELFNAFWANKAKFYPEYHHQITIGLMYTVIYDFVIFVVFIFLSSMFGLALIGKEQKEYRKIAIVSFFWILASALLLSLVGRAHNVVESRYLYLTSFPVLLLLSIFLYRFWFGFMRILVVIFLIGFTAWSYQDMQITIKRYVMQSTIRRQIVTDLTSLYPTVPKDVIFYVRCKEECKKNSDIAGVPNDHVLPFTSGPGWIFMLQYASKDERVYAPLFSRLDEKEFLWDYGAQGYRNIDGVGFGYFTEKYLLIETIKREQIDLATVIGLEYDESDFRLHDISSIVREELAKDMRYTTK